MELYLLNLIRISFATRIQDDFNNKLRLFINMIIIGILDNLAKGSRHDISNKFLNLQDLHQNCPLSYFILFFCLFSATIKIKHIFLMTCSYSYGKYP